MTTALTTTRRLARHVLSYRDAPLSSSALVVAKQCVLDWFAVTLAAHNAPLVRFLRDEIGGAGPATIVGTSQRCSPCDAALVNGAASHALDYDDTHHFVGHPTVGVFPAALAVAEWRASSGAAALRAFVAGVEAAAVLGSIVLPDHYERGFHATGTLGCFGAAAAAGLLLDLDEDQMTMALGLAGTQAAGLKAMFGSMAKPFHAGKAASNGVLAARLAKRGFTAHDDVLDADQGFIATQGRARPSSEARFIAPGEIIIETLFKYHAACYGTHSAIEAVSALAKAHKLSPDDIEAIDVRIHPSMLKVCNISAPRTGLEIKFSLSHLSALTILGVDTAAIETFSDATAERSDAVALRDLVRVQGGGDDSVTAAEVEITTRFGKRFKRREDAGVPLKDFTEQQARVARKYRSLTLPVLGAERSHRLCDAINNLDHADDVSTLLR